ncbi:MAG: hypothetical protein JJE22_05710 [Bacteroidia bacterium]|nr:hypothetical protein [Bacteroidia bacterium]
MTSGLTVDDKNELQELRNTVISNQPTFIRVLAKIISYIFHPVFVPVYVAWFIINIQPYLFAGFGEWKKTTTMIQFLVMYAFFPLVTTFLLKRLDFISSVYLKTQKDRIIPYIICMVYYFWVWYVLYRQPDYPSAIVQFSLAIFIASILGLMANIYMKISMHAIAVGVMLAFIILQALAGNDGFGVYIAVALLITGLVCTSRFIVSDHTQTEIYGGLFVGIISQLLANWFG